jgi:epoxyqueuosine reductase
MKSMLERLRAALQAELGPMESRVYVDTGPVVERAYAAAAGLGAWGKNTCLLHPEHGSWFSLGEVITDVDMQADLPRPDMCGTCTACLDACPTGALPAPYVLDATRCISYLTIELKGAIPEDRRAGVGRHVFGCDICQDVCPWNRRAPATTDPAFAPRQNLVAPDIEWLLSLSEDDFRRVFKNSPVRRTKYHGLLRNACIAAGNSHALTPSLKTRLTELAASPDPLIAEHAQWALTRLGPITDIAARESS